jgi:hypothetical protein
MTKTDRTKKASRVTAQSIWLKIAICLVVLLAGFGFWKFSGSPVQATMPVATTGVNSAVTSSFAPTVENKNAPAGAAPAAMVWIPGGEFSMGAQDPPGNDAVGMPRVRRRLLDG